jgi:hypothetical protein
MPVSPNARRGRWILSSGRCWRLPSVRDREPGANPRGRCDRNVLGLNAIPRHQTAAPEEALSTVGSMTAMVCGSGYQLCGPPVGARCSSQINQLVLPRHPRIKIGDLVRELRPTVFESVDGLAWLLVGAWVSPEQWSVSRKSRARAFNHPATTRRTPRSGPAPTPPWWTQPGSDSLAKSRIPQLHKRSVHGQR